MKLVLKASLLLLSLLANITRLPAGHAPKQQQSKRGLGEGKQVVLVDGHNQEDKQISNNQASTKSLSDSKLYFRAIGKSGGKRKFVKVKNMRCFFDDDAREFNSYTKLNKSSKLVEKAVLPEKKKPFSFGTDLDISTDLNRIDGKVSADIGLTMPHVVIGNLVKDAMGQLIDGSKQLMSGLIPPNQSEYSTSQRSNSLFDPTEIYKSIFDIIGMFAKVTDNIGVLRDERFVAFIKFLEEMLEKITNLPIY